MPKTVISVQQLFYPVVPVNTTRKTRSAPLNAQRMSQAVSKELFASTKKRNRPSFSRSARPEVAVPLYEQFIRRLTLDLGRSIQTGEFGADRKVTLVNDGRVTVIIDSKIRE
jgi:D-tyrosyl-tRNA(Tyr) deacylase